MLLYGMQTQLYVPLTCWTHAGSAAACQDAYLNDAATVAFYHNCTASGTGIADKCAVLDENSCTILDVHCTCTWRVVWQVWHLATSRYTGRCSAHLRGDKQR